MRVRNTVLAVGLIQITREDRFGEPVIRVFVGGRQALKFDCFARDAHLHLDPDGRNEVRPIISSDSLRWATREIREHLAELFRQAGFPHGAAEVEREAVRALIEEVGAALGSCPN